ncbi:T9SS type A sorting domain-containing protein [Chryseobacterium phocaeense]|uniref:T9SS type A sorting domain-containing protein n=1 Tax=Chryseobacterium phocaeense TaxID=1816690 RepID=UPI0011193F08|nr:T9SS type A sorting domain-containing protein [Chryseobacterium phocaeense]
MKKNNFLMMALISLMSIGQSNLKAQCPATSAFYSFSTGGKNYHLVREGRPWSIAASCAASRQGYLAEINNAAEQNGILAALQSPQAGIVLANTTAPDGGDASYVWIGGREIQNPNRWVWDGNMNGNNMDPGTPFWSGGSPMNGGMPVASAYANWGFPMNQPPVEPDNFNGNQDFVAMALTQWPFGNLGQWNDLSGQNILFFVIEYDGVLSTDEAKTDKSSVRIYPNAVTDFLTIESKKGISSVHMTDASGKKVKTVSGTGKSSERIDCTSLPDGVYLVNIEYQDKTASQHKVIKSNK